MATTSTKGRTIKPSTVLTVSGVSKTAKEWAEALGVPVQTIISRIKRGKPDAEACTAPPSQRGGQNRGQKQHAEPLTADEMKALLQQCSMRASTGIRNKAMIVLAWRAGLRCSEVLALKASDFSQSKDGKHTIRVLHGKGSKARVVGLDPTSSDVLQRWIDRRDKLGIRLSRLFCTLKGKPVSTLYVRKLMKHVARKAGIDKRVHFHGLRHTHAFELAQENVALHVIQQQLGHASVAVTDRYIRHLNPSQVIDVMQKRTW